MDDLSVLFSPYVTPTRPRYPTPGPDAYAPWSGERVQYAAMSPSANERVHNVFDDVGLAEQRHIVGSPSGEVENYVRALSTPQRYDSSVFISLPNVKINPANWDRFMANTEPSSNIEDRRGEKVPDADLAGKILGDLKRGWDVPPENLDWLLNHGFTDDFIRVKSPVLNKPPDSIGALLEALRGSK